MNPKGKTQAELDADFVKFRTALCAEYKEITGQDYDEVCDRRDLIEELQKKLTESNRLLKNMRGHFAASQAGLEISRSRREGLKESLRWALNEIEELMGIDSDGVPIHDCEFRTNPEAGYCEFRDKYFSAKFESK